MKKLIRLISLLPTGEFISGQALAEVLGVTRTTVSSWVNELMDTGIEINSIRGRGYKLLSPVSLHDKEAVLSILAKRLPSALTVVDISAESVSTNKTAMTAGYQLNDWKLFATEYQQSGRGRRGKQWQSPPCSNLLFSLGHKSVFQPDVLYLSSIITGIAVAKTLRRLTLLNVEIKWPNDIYINGKKLAGILCELQGSPQDEALLVIGVGVNVFAAPQDTDIPAVCIAQLMDGLDRDTLLAELAAAIILEFSRAEQDVGKTVLEQWPQFDFLAGKEIRLLRGDETTDGIACGIDGKGQLLLKTESGQTAINGGEVSVRW